MQITAKPTAPRETGPQATCRGLARHDDHVLHVELSISLLPDGSGKRFLVYPSRFACEIDGVDEPAGSYHLENWESALTSGAFFALRKAGLTPQGQRLLVRAFRGRLRAQDMDVVASLAAQCVSALCGESNSVTPPPQWQFEIVASVPAV
jgi:hypothetical protein